MSAESEAATLQILLDEAQAENGAIERKIDALSAKVDALVRGEKAEDNTRLDQLIAEVKALKEAVTVKVKARKEGKRKITFSVTGRDKDSAMITDAEITVN